MNKDETIDLMQHALDRLDELEDKIEQGTLVELPCKVGDKFYGFERDTHYNKEQGFISETKVYEDIIQSMDIEITDKGINVYCRGLNYGMYAAYQTKEEVEAKLKEWNNGK